MVETNIIAIGNETFYGTLNSHHTFVVKYNMENYTILDSRVDDSESDRQFVIILLYCYTRNVCKDADNNNNNNNNHHHIPDIDKVCKQVLNYDHKEDV